jgi:hypothetical protein
MAKGKRTKKQISEEARLKAENDPVVRELRRCATTIDAELRARRRGDAPASA